MHAALPRRMRYASILHRIFYGRYSPYLYVDISRRRVILCSNFEHERIMAATKKELKAIFASKTKELVSELEAWFEEETESIDGSIAAAAPSGSGGSIMGTCPAIDSKRVVDATVITKKVLDIELPPEIIKPGGYASCDEMMADLVPKLERVFIGDIKVKRAKLVKA